MDDSVAIFKSGLIDKAADLLHRLAGPMADELGEIFGDKLRVYRVKNLVSTMQKTERILKEAGISPNAIPPKLLLPIVEHSSVEDNETLQEMWAGLIATASREADSVSPSFVETLKQLTPDEARHIERIAAEILKRPEKTRLIAGTNISPHAFTALSGAPIGVSSDVFERLGLIRRDYDVNLRWGKGTTVEEAVSSLDTDIRYTFEFTGYAVRFLEACRGPRPNGG